MDKIPNRTDMISQLFRERQRFADQTGTALAKGVVEALDAVGHAAGFVNGFVAFGGEHPGIGLEEIGVAHRTLAIVRRK